MKFQLRKKEIRSKMTFNKKTARGLTKVEYYQAAARNMTQYAYIEEEKRRLSTPHKDKITQILEFYRNAGINNYENPLAKRLIGLYKKKLRSGKTRHKT